MRAALTVLDIQFVEHVVGKAALAVIAKVLMGTGFVDVVQNAAERNERLFGCNRQFLGGGEHILRLKDFLDRLTVDDGLDQRADCLKRLLGSDLVVVLDRLGLLAALLGRSLGGRLRRSLGLRLVLPPIIARTSWSLRRVPFMDWKIGLERAPVVSLCTGCTG